MWEIPDSLISGITILSSKIATVLLKCNVALAKLQVIKISLAISIVSVHVSYRMKTRIQDMCHAPLINNFFNHSQLDKYAQVQHYIRVVP